MLNRFSPSYTDMIKVDFAPLTYIEVQEGKPLIIKLSDKYIFKTELQKANIFVKFNTTKNLILENIEKLNNINEESFIVNKAKVLWFMNLIQLLYEISKQNYKGIIKKWLYYKYLKRRFLDDIDMLYSVFDTVLKYNSELKKKAQNLLSYDIYKTNGSQVTAGGQQLSDLIRINQETGEKYFIH